MFLAMRITKLHFRNLQVAFYFAFVQKFCVAITDGLVRIGGHVHSLGVHGRSLGAHVCSLRASTITLRCAEAVRRIVGAAICQVLR